jgi:hypothetical protein
MAPRRKAKAKVAPVEIIEEKPQENGASEPDKPNGKLTLAQKKRLKDKLRKQAKKAEK